jgi:heme a synthase
MPARPVPRWLHVWAIATVLVTLALLVLGQLVTSFRAGMADPIWPTEPWYLFVVGWREPDRGYLIEHSHRIAGFVVGGFVSVLALGIAGTDPRRGSRLAAQVLLAVLIAAFGQFHRELITQRDPAVPVTLPLSSLIAMAAALLGAIGILATGWRERGTKLRLLGVAALVAVMIQGLLGGFRVRLDALFGPELAPIHGIFAQVVFCLLVALAVLTGRPVASDLPDAARRNLNRLSLLLLGILFVQLIWGAMVRHAPDSLNQRLHLLTAFLAVALAVWLIRIGFNTARQRVAFTGWVLGLLIALQVLLGVEAWMGKFGEEARAGRSLATYLPEAEAVSVKQAATRTAHTLVGTGVLAMAVVFTLRVRARNAGSSSPGSTNDIWDQAIAPEPAFALSGKRP